jgi:hypothetical protein
MAGPYLNKLPAWLNEYPGNNAELLDRVCAASLRSQAHAPRLWRTLPDSAKESIEFPATP